MASANYYETLRVPPDASPVEIAAAYRRLARDVHPDRNPSPDAHRQMQALNEAYNTLRHAERRRRYDDLLASPPHRPGAAASTPPRPTAAPPAARSAWLSFQKRAGDDILFTIGHADDMPGLLAELQRRIPPAARRYDIAQNLWRVHAGHEAVLRSLFRNYAPVVTAPPPAPARPVRRPVDRRSAVRQPVARGGERSAWLSMALVAGAALVLYGLLFGRVILPATAQDTSDAAVSAPAEVAAAPELFSFPEDCTSELLAAAPTYLREACKTVGEGADRVAPATAAPFHMTTTRVASNIRRGPDTRYPVLTTAAPGTRLQLVGYTRSRGYVWYLTNFGGWIRADLVSETSDHLPLVPPDQIS
ncbi:MAG: DnaJ domain-containing protein [Caldilinea sp.]|nr:DnaJ domain-containing protein [Caldilineaceae bacterium]MCW5844974.1 DnaJ domain-containing protein [Caldilinea sp.]